MKVLNDTLEKYSETIEKKREANKNVYRRNKDKDDVKQNEKDYDKEYYNEHKQDLLNARKVKCHSDKEYREQVKQQQEDKYEQSKQLKQP